jgi:DNA-binding GntR family transcriptional regulator
VDPQFFEAIYQFRSAVEPLAVRLATPRLTKQAIARGRSLVEHGRDLVAVGDKLASLQADMDFHLFIYNLSENPLILETMRLYWRHIRRAMGRVLTCPGMSIKVWHEHRRILEQMIRGDADEAGELMRRHLIDACERVLKLEAANSRTDLNGVSKAIPRCCGSHFDKAP